MNDDARLETLEIKCAHLETALESLSDVVYRQQQALDQALATGRALAARLDELHHQADSTANEDEIPPHY
jgi:uncharacterized coiled-coil protein SlyX